MEVTEIGYKDINWIKVNHVRVLRKALVNSVIKLWTAQKLGIRSPAKIL
jgi:hypothetical protein